MNYCSFPWFAWLTIVYYHLYNIDIFNMFYIENNFVVLSKTNTKTAEVISFGDSRLLCGA